MEMRDIDMELYEMVYKRNAEGIGIANKEIEKMGERGICGLSKRSASLREAYPSRSDVKDCVCTFERY